MISSRQDIWPNTGVARNTIGFDDVFTRLHAHLAKTSNTNSFPPYNILKLSASKYVIVFALAGFTISDINIELTPDNVLNISGERKSDDGDYEYIYRGIAERSFTRQFTLADGVEVEKANLENGVLQIYLNRTTPDQKSRKIEINPETKTFLTENQIGKVDLNTTYCNANGTGKPV